MANSIDRFGGQAESYAAARPTYPEEFFAFVAKESLASGCALDCATGNGQAAVELAKHFEHVIATDASENHLSESSPHLHVTYRLASAEESGLEETSVDIITVAQALHWFDRPVFFSEVDRILKPGGSLAVWTYNLHTISPEVDRVVQSFHDGLLDEYWSPHRDLVEEGYASITFPFESVLAPAFQMGARWTLDRLIGYLNSWSAVGAYVKKNGADPVPLDALSEAWGEAEERPVRRPLTIHLRRKP